VVRNSGHGRHGLGHRPDPAGQLNDTLKIAAVTILSQAVLGWLIPNDPAQAGVKGQSGAAVRDPHFADFVLGVLVGFTLGASLTAIAWAISD
jgi:hypothetical protein